MVELLLPNLPVVFNNKYQLIELLGRGSFGAVYKSIDLSDPTRPLVAIKLLARGKSTKYIEGEFVNHRLLSFHPHVIGFKEAFLTDEYLCLAMEFAAGGTLHGYMNKHRRLPEELVRRFFQQLILGVDFCHEMGVILRDIKLENVLLQAQTNAPEENWILKLCDFGYSKSEAKSAPDTTVGTLVYMAPEVITSSHTGQYTKAADIWSCGIMLYIMVCGCYPFDLSSNMQCNNQAVVVEILQKMLNKQIQVPPHIAISPACRHLLDCMLDPLPQTRISMMDIFQHPWFTHNLPPAFHTYNRQLIAKYSSQRSSKQPVETIKEIVQQAGIVPLQERLRMGGMGGYSGVGGIGGLSAVGGLGGFGGMGGMGAGMGGRPPVSISPLEEDIITSEIRTQKLLVLRK